MLTAPLFRAATKPAMMFGVPTKALIAFEAPLALPIPVIAAFSSVWWAALLLFPALLILLMLRDMSKRDEQYLLMWLLEVKEKWHWLFMRRNRIRQNSVIPPRPLRGRRFMHD